MSSPACRTIPPSASMNFCLELEARTPPKGRCVTAIRHQQIGRGCNPTFPWPSPDAYCLLQVGYGRDRPYLPSIVHDCLVTEGQDDRTFMYRCASQILGT